MTTIIIMLCASFAILAGYTAYAIWRTGVPRNLSETYYTLKERGYPGGLFCVAMLLTALFALVPMIEAGGPEYLAFISCVSLMFVALAPEFGMRIEGKVHFTATAVAGTAALAWSATAFHLSWITPAAALLAIVYPIVKDRRKWLFWLEMAVFAATYINIAIGLILR